MVIAETCRKYDRKPDDGPYDDRTEAGPERNEVTRPKVWVRLSVSRNAKHVRSFMQLVRRN